MRTLSTQSGFNLIEVLIALVVLCIGLLGVAALQIQGVRFNHGSYSRSQAVMLANDYAERMYANVPGVNAFNYAPFSSDGTVTGTTAVDCTAPPAEICGTEDGTTTPDDCTAAQVAAYDQFVVACGLPNGVGTTRYGGLSDLPGGVIQVVCRDAADANDVDPCVAGSPHRITVQWTERASATGGAEETLNYAMTVMP